MTLLLNPLLYIGCLLLWWERHLTVRRERRFFGTRISRVWKPLLWRWIECLIAGILLSAACLATGVTLSRWDVAAMTVLTLALGLLRARLSAAVYAIGALAILGTAARLWPSVVTHPALATRLWAHLADVHVLSWLGLCAGVLLTEGVLTLLRQHRFTSPALLLGRRGRPVGAFLLQWSFVLPVVAYAPGTITPLHSGWAGWPWAGVFAGVFPSGVALIGMPLLIGFSGLAATQRPRPRARRVALHSIVSGLLLVADIVAVRRFGVPYAFAGGAFVIVARELLLWQIHRREMLGDPLYSPVADGVRIIATVPGSLADVIGLRPGEVVTHVNQVPVHTAYDLHFALDQNPAYAKFQVVDDQGEIRLLGKPVYAGERHKLGLIPLPEGTGEVSYRQTFVGLYEGLYAKLTSARQGPDWTEVDAAAHIDE